jgi:hypothetical protein
VKEHGIDANGVKRGGGDGDEACDDGINDVSGGGEGG